MQYDVFISYAHNDNLARHSEDGWVDSFHKALYEYLTGKLGRKAQIWRDVTKLRGNDILDPAIVKDIKNSRIFIPILSPGFINSTYCADELKVFCSQSNVFQGSKGRVFPIVKERIGAVPPLIGGNLRKFEFFSVDEYGELIEELNPDFGESFKNKFYQKVNDVAREVAEFILKNWAAPAPVPPPPSPSPADDVPVIYFAEPSPDLFDKYLEIKRDLEERRNHGTLKVEFSPQPLPEDPGQIAEKPDEVEDYKRAVRDDIGKSRLTIHLMGKRHNGAPFGSSQSYLDLAAEVAAERDGEPDFNRLIWIPKDIYSGEETQERSNERHKAFINRIRQTGVSGDGLMQDSFEKFKSRIVEVLENKTGGGEEKRKEEEEARWIYVLYDKADLDSAQIVEDKLQECGFPIFSTRDYLDPALRGSAEMDVIEEHNKYLAMCDAVLIYWHNSPLTWVRQNVADLPKIKPRRKGRTFRAQAVFCDGNIQAKSAFRSPPPPNLLKVEGLSNLSKFLDKLN